MFMNYTLKEGKQDFHGYYDVINDHRYAQTI